ncbi:MAG: cache domain-containing protein [Desulfobulbaceae bacterium]|nr:cache domain-containing protein [Desulfobulbaceae bacterium]
MFQNVRIRTKLIVTFLAVAGLSAISIWLTLVSVISSDGRRDIADFEKREMSRIKSGLQDYVNIAWQIADQNLRAAQDKEHLQLVYGPRLVNVIDMADSIVQQALTDAAGGRITVDEAKNFAREEIRKLRYDHGTGYIFIIDDQLPVPKAILHPLQPKLEGKILDAPEYNCALGQNKNLFVAMVEVCRSAGAGFVDYLWPKPGKEGAQPKLSYCRLVKEWGWILGTGVYVDDAVADAVAQTKEDIRKIRYADGAGYLWINDTGEPLPKMLMHPLQPELEGKVLDDPKFNTALGGKENFFKAMVDVSKAAGEGFVDYSFGKQQADGTSRQQDKLSFVRLFKPLNWVIGTGVYLDDVQKILAEKKEAQRRQQRVLLMKLSLVFVAIGAVALALFWTISNRIALPLQKCAAFCVKIGLGDLGERLEVQQSAGTAHAKKSGDEVAAIALALNGLRDSLKEKVDMAEKIADGDLVNEVKVASDKDTLSISLNRMIANLRELLAEIRETADVVSSSSHEMTAVTTELAAGAEETSVQANAVAGATEEINVNASSVSATFGQVAANVAGVARATENMNKGIAQISSKAEEGARITDTAYQKAQKANETIKNLVTSAAEIDEVTKTIGEITEQTKLLALNATIEAARAGEAGKGFAVVANEVKELALQSAGAAENISTSIREVQKSIGEAVTAMTEVAVIIKEVNDSSTAISGSIQEQGNITSQIAGQIADSNTSILEIDKAMEELSLGIREVSSNIQGVSQVAQDSGKGVQQLSQAAADLSRLATRLQTLVHKFKI